MLLVSASKTLLGMLHLSPEMVDLSLQPPEGVLQYLIAFLQLRLLSLKLHLLLLLLLPVAEGGCFVLLTLALFFTDGLTRFRDHGTTFTFLVAASSVLLIELTSPVVGASEVTSSCWKREWVELRARRSRMVSLGAMKWCVREVGVARGVVTGVEVYDVKEEGLFAADEGKGEEGELGPEKTGA